jgi:molybdopterin/thiamine biosynthesis adenylyltransferase
LSEQWRIARWVTVRAAADEVQLLHDQVVRLRNLGPVSGRTAELLTRRTGFSEPELADLIGARSARAVIERLSGLLMLRPFVADEPDPPAHLLHQAGYLEAMTSDPVTAQKRIDEARIAVVGLGGIGGLVLQHLLGAGVRDLLLVDGDVVEPANLNRQFLFTPDDVGRPKAEVAAEYAGRFAGARVETRQMFINGPDDLDDSYRPDFVVCAADQPPGRITRWLASYAARLGAGFIACGVGINRGYWGPIVVPGVTPCLSCSRPELADGDLDDRPAALAVSFGPVNSMIAAGVAADVLWAITDLRPTQDLATMRVLDLTRPSLDLLRPAGVARSCAEPLCSNSRD